MGKGDQHVRIEPLGLAVQNRADDYRFVSGGRIASGQALAFVVSYDWSGSQDATAYDNATGAKRPRNLGYLVEDGYAIDACTERRHFFETGIPGHVVLRAVVADAKAPKIPVRFRIEDYWDHVIQQGRLELPVTAGQVSIQAHAVPTDKTGMFRFIVEYEGFGGRRRSAQALYGVVPERKEPPAGWDFPFGMHLHATAHHLRLGWQMGVAWDRAHDTMAYTYPAFFIRGDFHRGRVGNT